MPGFATSFYELGCPFPRTSSREQDRKAAKRFGRFLDIALKSTSELEYHLITARDIGAIRLNEFESLSAQTIEVRKMLYGLRTRVTTSRPEMPSSVPA
jgi:hypothetical protein